MLDNKIILITGGSGGIGKETVLKFARNGYKTYTTTRNLSSPATKDLQKTADTENLNITPLYLDLTVPDSIKKTVGEIISREGKLDILINNAAVGYFSSVEDIKKDRLMSQFDVNVFGTLQVIQNVIPYMRKQNSGKIINVSSILGFSTAALNAPYSASKYVIECISETLALEVKPFGIDVVIIQPGDFHSNFIKNSLHQEYKNDSPYFKLYKRKDDNIKNQEAKRDPKVFANKVFNICQKKKPKLRYMVGKEVLVKKTLHTILPGNLWIKLLRHFYGW